MDEAVPPGKDDRRLWYTIYAGRDGVSLKKKCQFAKNNNTSPWAYGRRKLLEVDSRAEKGCEFHG